MTARAVMVHRKAKAKAANARPSSARQTRAKTEARKVDAGKGYVVIADDTDPDEYVRC